MATTLLDNTHVHKKRPHTQITNFDSWLLRMNQVLAATTTATNTNTATDTNTDTDTDTDNVPHMMDV